MLDIMDLKLEGRHHSGIDDASNIAKIALALLKTGHNFAKEDISRGYNPN